jgi:hypothetical protein
MSFERAMSGTGLGAEPGVPATDGSGVRAEADVTPQLRLQILSTEHWSLLASRSLAWNESFSRASMFLSTLSGALVALALVAQASDFREEARLVALVILPVVLFVGLTTVVRLGASNYHDALCVVGMNRIRGMYLQMAPDLAPIFVMSPHDDARGVGVTMALDVRRSSLLHVLSATPMVIGVVNGVLGATIAALVAFQLQLATVVALALGVATFLATMVLQGMHARSNMARGQAELRPLFPSPDES